MYKRLYVLLAVCALAVGTSPQTQAAAETTLTGVVTAAYANQLVFKTKAAVTYRAESSYATVVRRNGSAIARSDVRVGDKIEVRGQVWSDRSISASFVRDVSLYTHTGTFSGKITAIDPINATLVLQSSQNASQKIHTTTASLFTKNGAVVTLQDISVGMSATVKGTWDRSRSDVTASSVRATVRLLNIDITGDLVMKNGSALTVVANGVIYPVDASHAKVKSKNNKPMSIAELLLGPIRVQGKHIAESVQIRAATIKDLTAVK